MPPKSILFFDGANHLPFLRFRHLRFLTHKRRIGLVITSHREGLLPTLVYCRPHLELLTELTERLLPEPQAVRQSHLAALFESHRGNIRECLWQLYDEYAEDLDIINPLNNIAKWENEPNLCEKPLFSH